MRKRLLAVLAVLVLAALVVFWLRGNWHGSLTQRAEPPAPPGGRAETQQRPPVPNIALQINGKVEPVVSQGTPLVFTIRVANARAMNVAADNQVRRAYAAELEAQVARGEVARETVAGRLGGLRQPAPVPVVRLGDETARWHEFVRFVRVQADGRHEPLSWKVRPITPAASATLTLDSDTTAQFDWAVDADAVSLTAGEYRFVAVLEVPQTARLPADRWRGRVQSEPVRLAVEQRPVTPAPAQQETFELDQAQYFAAIGDPARSLEHAQNVLTLNPRSIQAHILVGEARERQGDLKGALAAFETATAEFYRQNPDSYEAPVYLIRKTSSLMERLRSRR